MRRPGALTRGVGKERAGMGDSGRAPTEGLLWGCGDGDWGDDLWGFGPDAGAIGGRAGGASGLPVVGHGETSRRRGPTGKPPGAFGPMLRVPAGRCFGDLFLRSGKGLRTTRRMPGASCPSSNIWRWYGRSGVTPKRAPIPALRGRAFERPARFGRGMGWLARKRYSRVGPGPRGMVWLALRSIQGWRLPALRRGRAPQVFRPGYGRHPQRQILAGA